MRFLRKKACEVQIMKACECSVEVEFEIVDEVINITFVKNAEVIEAKCSSFQDCLDCAFIKDMDNYKDGFYQGILKASVFSGGEGFTTIEDIKLIEEF